ncbi:16S rRNA (cytosine(1402)-N(4))-methyltransferase RsmH [Nereida ignava]|uniref:Ribosomal RNA small subunit methyltransferase H n=1 Tax=Nereida ignava TaxID=282199 RepID=A0A0U1NIJ2_9RHOB|nr:16S rRNA (cytosine(1402)-N(4))-methyltransferase RsmH [Nereida ignava]CRK74554.1 Ribosomal RNA small subunit methyltransferase H [Nereida ignava]SFJ18289.1 16S rRNA (cytosine1402-N4)-methyltransferase [Nereida ignava DSM 16309]
MGAASTPSADPHIPVLLRPLLEAVAPVGGVWLDGTLGAGGYTRGLLEAGAEQVIGVDQDPLALEMAKSWADDRVTLVAGNFAKLDTYAENLDGIVLDLGVSSMQLDQAERGFSFMKDGPLDMRMAQDGPSAADLIATLSEAEIANVLFLYGEERASRRIAKAIVKARAAAPITTTLELADLIAGQLPRSKPGQSHPATRSFQAIRIAVNGEYDALYQGLMASERALKPGGKLAVVTFHSTEDRMVKRFLQMRAGTTGNANRYAPEAEQETPAFTLKSRKAIGPDAQELEENPRSRSAKLRVAIRSDAPADVAGETLAPRDIGMPTLGKG